MAFLVSTKRFIELFENSNTPGSSSSKKMVDNVSGTEITMRTPWLIQ